MKNIWIIICASSLLLACKNNGQQTSSKQNTEVTPIVSLLQEIVIDRNKYVSAKPDFQVLKWEALHDTLRVIVRYSGGCEEHIFNAYFSGAWQKSLPPKAVIDIEHLNPNNDACRSLVKDTLLFNLKSTRYRGQTEVEVKWKADGNKTTNYLYEK